MRLIGRFLIAAMINELNSVDSIDEFNSALESSLKMMKKKSKDEEYINELNERLSLYEKKYITKNEFKESLTELLKMTSSGKNKDSNEELEVLRTQNEQLRRKCSELEESQTKMKTLIVKLSRQQEETEKNVTYNETLKQACIALKSEINDLEQKIASLSAANYYVQPINQNIPVNNQSVREAHKDTNIGDAVTAKVSANNASTVNKAEENDLFELTLNVNKVLLSNTTNIMTIRKYLERYRKTDDIVSFLKENEDYENLAVYKKKIDRFNDSINKTIDMLTEKVSSFYEDEISEKIIEKMFRKVSDDIIQKIVPSVLKRIEAYNDEKYIEFMKKINAYMENIGVYTYDFAKVGEQMDKYTDYYDIVPIPMNKPELIGIIQQINVPPYLVNYKTADGMDHFVTCGSLNVYSEDQ